MSERAYERALEALGHRERTSAELAQWLGKRGFDDVEVGEATDRLTEAGVIDDARFAARYAADKRELRGWGPERIREALVNRGIDAADVEAAVAPDGASEQLDRALELLRRRGPGPTDARGCARAVAFLARRGYDSEVAHEAVRVSARRAA